MLLSIYRIMKFEILGDQLVQHAYFTGEEMVAVELNVSQLLVLIWYLREC